MTAFDLQVTQLISRARLLERLVHDRGPWSAIVYSHDMEYRVPLQRDVLSDELAVVLTGYVPAARPLDMIEVYCGPDLVTMRPVDGDGPCRFRIEAGIGAPEPVL